MSSIKSSIDPDSLFYLLNIFPENIAILDTNGTIIFVNNKWKDFADKNGSTEEKNWVNINYLEICDDAKGGHSEEGTLAAQGIRDVINGTKDNFTVEYPCHSPGKKKWFNLKVIPLSTKYPTQVMLQHIDITSKKNAEETIKKSEEKYRILADNTMNCIWTMGTDLNFTYINPAIEDLTGHTPEEWIGSNLVEYCDDESIVIMKERIEHAISFLPEIRVINFESWLIKKNGEPVPVEIGGKIIIDENGDISGFQGITKDITERKNSEKKLIESEEKFRTLADLSPVGVYCTDQNGMCKYVNQRWCEIAGMSYSEALNEGWIKNLYPEDKDKITASWNEMIIDRSSWEDEYRFVDGEGKVRWVTSLAKEVTSSDNSIGYIGVNVDITDRKHAEQELLRTKIEAEKANRTKSEFLSTMSHELRTPLNSIIGFSEILLMQMPGELNPKQHDYLSKVSKSGKHLLSVINDILDISKVESGETNLRFNKINIDDLFKETKGILFPLSKSKDIKLEFLIEDSEVFILADRTKMKQIIYNLVNNAIKFTNISGNVQVEAIEQDDHVEFNVRDNGIGISKENIPMIFDPFKQVDSSLCRNYGGTGLGLSISKKLIELHGGNIQVKSDEGIGTVFTFTIPKELKINHS